MTGLFGWLLAAIVLCSVLLGGLTCALINLYLERCGR